MKWYIWLFLLTCFLGRLTMYYVGIDRLEQELIFIGGIRIDLVWPF